MIREQNRQTCLQRANSIQKPVRFIYSKNPLDSDLIDDGFSDQTIESKISRLKGQLIGKSLKINECNNELDAILYETGE